MFGEMMGEEAVLVEETLTTSLILAAACHAWEAEEARVPAARRSGRRRRASRLAVRAQSSGAAAWAAHGCLGPMGFEEEAAAEERTRRRWR